MLSTARRPSVFCVQNRMVRQNNRFPPRHTGAAFAVHSTREKHMAHAAGNPSALGPEQRLTGAYLAIALLALFVGVVTGLFQALSHAGINLYPQLTPVVASYYQGLTLHGVMNALVWTTFFICGFLQFIATRALERPLASRGLAWATYGLMTGGLVLAAVPLVGNAATVMFTFYPPLRAHWAFYVGLTLVVAGTWLVTVNLAITYRA